MMDTPNEKDQLFLGLFFDCRNPKERLSLAFYIGTMIKLFQTKNASKDGSDPSASKRTCAAQLRINKDVNELELPPGCHIDFPDKNDFLNFRLSIAPDEGFYKGGRFLFIFKVPANYPHDPPKVHCETRVYHPNIDMSGNICLNILREDWKPVLTVQSVVHGLLFLLLDPNPDDPLNKDAAQVLQTNRKMFEQNVRRMMQGGGSSMGMYK
ncbi:NEDD8-conjugating enzyme Ubc12-like isoform X1 [Varroa jacobsoni]|uniref:NEDD8-conjugating enzyme Ubc12-like isoform X1 n=1 Tax=Varroa jacobsoni TaxID=62625 RepID=UPI000BF3D547|nr:NEDD8-conjugating enzyme Ubc12-like isoform X1 [Varroa jacobsoni]